MVSLLYRSKIYRRDSSGSASMVALAKLAQSAAVMSVRKETYIDWDLHETLPGHEWNSLPSLGCTCGHSKVGIRWFWVPHHNTAQSPQLGPFRSQSRDPPNVRPRGTRSGRPSSHMPSLQFPVRSTCLHTNHSAGPFTDNSRQKLAFA